MEKFKPESVKLLDKDLEQGSSGISGLVLGSCLTSLLRLHSQNGPILAPYPTHKSVTRIFQIDFTSEFVPVVMILAYVDDA
jgi:hypothetical protein